MPVVTRLDLYHVALPLKKKIRHASHERSASDSLVARVTLGDGSVGFGEGVPRDYVTGETIATAFDALTALDAARQIGDPRETSCRRPSIGSPAIQNCRRSRPTRGGCSATPRGRRSSWP